MERSITVYTKTSNEQLKRYWQDINLCHSPYYCMDVDWREQYTHMSVSVGYNTPHVLSITTSNGENVPIGSWAMHPVTKEDKHLHICERVNMMIARIVDAPLDRHFLNTVMELEITPDQITLKYQPEKNMVSREDIPEPMEMDTE